MTVTNEQIQALKAADHKRIAACVKACEGISTENLINNVPLKQGLAGLNKRIRDAEARRDQLLAERDADKALIAKLQCANAAQDDHINQQADRIESLEKTNHGLGKRLCAVESSHKKLRESMAAIHNTIRLDGVGVSLSSLLSASKRAYEESAFAAGITLVVEE